MSSSTASKFVYSSTGDSCMKSENRPQKKSDDIISSLFESLDDNDDMDMMGMSLPTAYVFQYLALPTKFITVNYIYIDKCPNLNDLCLCGSTPSKDKGGMKSVGLSEYAKHALKEICSQEWVREKFLKNPEVLFTPDLLLDKMLSSKQVRLSSVVLLMKCAKCVHVQYIDVYVRAAGSAIGANDLLSWWIAGDSRRR